MLRTMKLCDRRRETFDETGNRARRFDSSDWFGDGSGVPAARSALLWTVRSNGRAPVPTRWPVENVLHLLPARIGSRGFAERGN